MLGKRDNNNEHSPPKKYSKHSSSHVIKDNRKISSYKSNPSSFVCCCYGSISINEDRNLISFGKNKYGILGHEEIGELINTPRLIPNLMNIKMVGCGNRYTSCIDYDGKLFTFGEIGTFDINELGTHTNIPHQIMNIPKVDLISCGYNFIMCLTNDRYAYSLGCNEYGQLGIGNSDEYLSPQLITDLNDIEFVQFGTNHTICKTYSNKYYSWGYNEYGQLGQGNYKKCYKPIKCSNWPEDIIDIKCGWYHVLLLTSTGYVYSFGCNHFYGINSLLGLNDIITAKINIPTLIKDLPLIKRIECGYLHSMCIDINDKVWVFGNNFNGELGLGDKENRYKPILNESLHDIIDISSGGDHTFVKTITNEIYVFGGNQYSKLGLTTSQKRQLTPIQVFKDNEDIWVTNTIKSKQKSARK